MSNMDLDTNPHKMNLFLVNIRKVMKWICRVLLLNSSCVSLYLARVVIAAHRHQLLRQPGFVCLYDTCTM